MGRIKGPSSVFRERLVEKQPSYKVGEPNYLREGLKDIGAVLTVGTQIYQSPMLKDAAAGLFDLFSSDKKGVTETVKKASEAEQMKEAAMARRADAMKDMEEARPPVGPPQGPVEMPKADAAAQKEIQDLKKQAVAAGAVGGFMADQELSSEELATNVRMAEIDKDRERIQAIAAAAGPQAERAYDIYNQQRQQFNQLSELARLETDPEAKQEYIDQANSAKTQMNQAFKAFEQVRGIKDTLAELDKADTEAQLRLSNIQGLRDELKNKSLARAQNLNRLATEKAAALTNTTEEQINNAVNGILERGVPDAAKERYDYIKSKLEIDPETGDIMLNVPTEERVAMSNNPNDATLLAAATKQLEKDIQQQKGMYATGGDLGSALAGLEEAGVDISPEPTETAPEGTAPAEPGVTPTPTEEVSSRLIQDTPLADVSPAERARLVNQVKGRLLTDFEGAAPQINAVFEQLRSQYGDDALGSTPGEVESNMRKIMQGLTQGMGQAVPEGGIQVPDISGMSIQEAENVAMEIAASGASMSAKTAAMRQLLGQAGNIDDVVPAWMARGGTLGYLDRDMAADRLRKAFSGMVPRPKAAKPITYSEAVKLLEAPARIRKGEAQADLAATRAAKAQMEAPIDIRNALLKFFPLLAKDAKLSKPGGGKRRISKEDLEEFREEVMSGSDRSRAFFDSQANSLTTQASKLNQLTVKEVRELSEKEIVEQYGADLKQYLRDIRDAKTDAAATAALNKAKQKAKSSMETRADKYRKSSKRLAQIGAQLRLARIQKDEKAKEKLIREANDILMSIQQDM